MNNQPIANSKTEVPKGIALNDKDYITSLLTCLKDMEKNYVIAMTEASNEHLYQAYHQAFCELAALQRETYELMFRHGWYQIEQAESKKVTKKANQLSGQFQELQA